MSTTIKLTKDELAELLEFTRKKDAAAAVKVAVREYINYVKRLQLMELSGRVEIQDNWAEMEEVELKDAKRRSRAR